MEGCLCIASHMSFSRSSQENVWKKSLTKGNSKAAGCMAANLPKTNLHVLLRSFNNISFLYALLKFRTSIFKEHLCEANCVQKGWSYKHLANVNQKNSYLPRVHRTQSKIKITANEGKSTFTYLFVNTEMSLSFLLYLRVLIYAVSRTGLQRIAKSAFCVYSFDILQLAT